MTRFKKTTLALGVIGTIAVAAATTSEARVRVYASDPWYAYTGDPAYAGYGAYAYAPGYAHAPGYAAYGYAPRYRYDSRYRSVPRHYDPMAGYNSNTVAPWQDWKYQGYDY